MDEYNKHDMKRSYRRLECLFDYSIVEETFVLITVFINSALYRKSELCIPRNETARPHSQ